MNIQQELEIVQITHGTNILLPTPPVCTALMERARAEGIPVGQLFVLSCSLLPGVRGSYDRISRDLWCHYDASGPRGDQSIMQCLLTLLAHARLGQPIPATIEEDWQQEQNAWREAVLLARAWELEEIFLEDDLTAREREAEHLLSCHLAAGQLAGNSKPFVARAAYSALLDTRYEREWSIEQFEDALYGASERDEDNAAVLAFDRTLLRSSWSIPYRASREGPPFGEWTLPQPVSAQNVLRHALEQASRVERMPQQFVEREMFDAPLRLYFMRVESDLDLARVVDSANAWLIEEGRGLPAEGMWWLYAGPSERLYRLTVRYKQPFDETIPDSELPPARELWILFRSGERLRNTEAAYQRYILSWLKMQEVRCEPLVDGLHLLWAWLGGN
jgi:hypothetical protein